MDERPPPVDLRDGHERPCPYMGVEAFGEADADYFFGRNNERKIIITRLRTSRLTVLYAESGVGKTSLLRAGVAARLRQLAWRDLKTRGFARGIPVVFNTWKDDPVAELIDAIAIQTREFLAETKQPVAAALGDGPEAGWLPEIAAEADGASMPEGMSGGALISAVRTAADALNANLLIVLDQFEEHLGIRRAQREPERFGDQLTECINSPDLRANFLIAVREDAYGRVGDLFRGRIGNAYNNYYHLGYLTRAAAQDAIVRPLEDVYNAGRSSEDAVEIGEGLIDAVLQEVTPERDLLRIRGQELAASGVTAHADEIEAPFLQLVMRKLWECEAASGSRVLRKATLEELGGAEEIVRAHLEDALETLSDDQIQLATDMFQNLVTPSGTKIAQSAADLAQMTSHDEATVAATLKSLYAHRIIRSVDPAPGSTEVRYEIFHDKFSQPILERLGQQKQARLEQAHKLEEQARKKAERDARRFKRVAMAAGMLAAGVVIALVVIAAVLHTANQEKRTAEYFDLITRADSQLTSRPDIALLLLLAADANRRQRVAERSLVATLQAVQGSGTSGILHGHTDAVESVAFSQYGGMLASGSADGTIRLWHVAGETRYPLGRPLAGRGPVFSVAFSPDGRTLASGMFNQVVLWNVASRRPDSAVPVTAGAVASVAVDPKGPWVAAGGSGGAVLLWNPHSGQMVHVSLTGTRPVKSVAFSPSGDTLAAASGSTVAMFNVITGQPVGRRISLGEGDITGIAFNPTGTVLAATQGPKVILWKPAASRPMLRKLSGPSNVLYSLAFSPDGKTIAASGVATIEFWSTTKDSLTHQLTGPPGAVYSIAFSPDGDTLASAGADRTIRLWQLPIAPLYGQPIVRSDRPVSSVAISPSGRTIASATGPLKVPGVVYLTNRGTRKTERMIRPGTGRINDIAFDPAAKILAVAKSGRTGAIQLYNTTTGQLIKPTLPVAGPIFSVAFNHSGSMLVSGGGDHRVRLWNVSTHEAGGVLSGQRGAVYSVTFNPSGTEVASGSSDRTVQIWNVGAQPGVQMIRQDDSVFGLAFSPNGHVLASGGADGTVRLWGLKRRSFVPSRVLTGHTSLVHSVAFSPDGNTLVSASSDRTIRLWDVASGSEIGNPLTGDTAAVNSVAFSAGGKFLASGSADGDVRVWQAVIPPSSFTKLSATVCAFLGAGLSRSEWSQYAPGVAYERTCSRATPG